MEYLGKYINIFDNIIKDINFAKTYADTFNNQNYAKEIIKSNIIEPNFSDENSVKKDVFEKIKNKINEKCKIEIKDIVNEEKKIMKICMLLKLKKKIRFKKIKKDKK